MEKPLQRLTPEDLAKSLQEIIDEEGFDTYVREGLYIVVDRLRELAETHKPDILRDLRDLGWIVLHHEDLVGQCYDFESPSTIWILHRVKSVNEDVRPSVQARGKSDEDALWLAAGKIAEYELPNKKAFEHARRLIKKGESFKKAIEKARAKFKGK